MNELRKQIIATEKRIRSIDVLSPAVREKKVMILQRSLKQYLKDTHLNFKDIILIIK